jgi:hypothetical protein
MAEEEAKQETSTKKAANRVVSLLGLLFNPKDGADMFSKMMVTFSIPYGTICVSHKTELFINTAVENVWFRH